MPGCVQQCISAGKAMVKPVKSKSHARPKKRGETPKQDTLLPEIRAEVKRALDEELKHREKAQEILEMQAETKRLEILNKLNNAIENWQKTGVISPDLEEPKKIEKISKKGGSILNISKLKKGAFNIAKFKKGLASLAEKLKPFESVSDDTIPKALIDKELKKAKVQDKKPEEKKERKTTAKKEPEKKKVEKKETEKKETKQELQKQLKDSIDKEIEKVYKEIENL